jgi:hypothetical protein
MATSEDVLNQFGTGLSSVKKGIALKDLGLIDLEKELKEAQKTVNEYDKKVNASPGFSSAQSDSIYQRDLSIARVLALSALLTAKSQAYKIVGGVLSGGVSAKENALANKYKQFDLNGAVETANAYQAAQTERGGGMNPLAPQFLPLVKKGSSFVPASPSTTTPPTTVPKTTGTSPTSTTVAPMGTQLAATTTGVPKYTSGSQFEAANPPLPTTPVTTVKPTNTGTGTKLGKNEALVNGKKVVVGGSKWQQIIQDEFGSMWDVYNDNPDVHKVIDQSVKEGWYNDETKLTARLQNTNWFRTTQSATRQYNIKKSTDPATLEADINKGIEDLRAYGLKSGSGVVLSDASLRMLAENKIKFGWSDQQTTNAVGSESAATATSGGPQGTMALRQGTVSVGLRTVADNYAQKVDPAMLDQWTTEILKGNKTEAQFTEQMKLQASQQYRSLAPQIDKGQDVKTAVSMYSNAAQNVLGIDPSTIDWTQDKWNTALNYKDPKTNEYRTMDAFEWNKHLRSQPEWQNTDDAKQTYRSAAMSIAKAFGKTS